MLENDEKTLESGFTKPCVPLKTEFSGPKKGLERLEFSALLSIINFIVFISLGLI
jgi:hypothetical protein